MKVEPLKIPNKNTRSNTQVKGKTKKLVPDLPLVAQKETPMFPSWIYENLPDPFKTGASLFGDPREKDTFLISAIVFSSGLLPNYSFLYAGEKYYTNLYQLIIAPAGSGKGKMKAAKKLGKQIIDHINKENETSQAQYDSELHLYNSLSKKDRSGPPPEEPIPKRLIIPADSSRAFFTKALSANGGHGIMFETEADLMSKTQGNSWSDYSVELRNGFEHETITSGRVSDIKFTGVEFPKLTILLSGTPAQVKPLISSVENGLFSRFIYYYFNPAPVWKSPFSSNISLDDHFKPLSQTCYTLWRNLKSRKSELLFSLNREVTPL